MTRRGIFFEREQPVGVATVGRADSDIARELHLSVRTIETHMEHIGAKLGIHSADSSWSRPQVWTRMLNDRGDHRR